MAYFPIGSSSLGTKSLSFPFMATSDTRLVIGMTMAIFFASSILAYPDLLQDVCVAKLNSDITTNGFAWECSFSVDDFFYDGLSQPGYPNNTLGSTVKLATVLNITGLNTLGMSMARIDFAPGGINPPHTHPRATEIVFMLEGELDVSFITTNNKLYSKSIKTGEVFIFPRGLIHFQKNNKNVHAAAIVAFNSQFPGTQRVVDALFASSPSVANNVLSKTFRIRTKDVKKIKSRFVHRE